MMKIIGSTEVKPFRMLLNTRGSFVHRNPFPDDVAHDGRGSTIGWSTILSILPRFTFYQSAGVGVGARGSRIKDQQFCQSSPDSHFVNPVTWRGSAVNISHEKAIAYCWSWGGEKPTLPHYLRAKQGVTTSMINKHIVLFQPHSHFINIMIE